jgi:Flp pilus assembly protein TadG
MRKRLHTRRNKSGQTLAEFALLVPVFFFVLIGIVDLASVIYTYSQVAYSASAGARWASVRGSTYACSTCTPTGPAAAGDVTTYVRGVGTWPNAGSAATVSTTWTGNGCQGGISNCPGSIVQVSVQYSYQLGLPGGFFTAVTLPLTATTQMVITQ